MKQVVYLGKENIAITFSSIGKTVIMQDGQLYTVDTVQYRNQLSPDYTRDAEIVK